MSLFQARYRAHLLLCHVASGNRTEPAEEEARPAGNFGSCTHPNSHKKNNVVKKTSWVIQNSRKILDSG
jgi:hypothetical protein